MLNKDEYNQEEYEEYYRQETGATTEQSHNEKSGLLGKLIILLILLALAIAGYFGYKAMNNQSTVTTTEEDIDDSLKVSAESSLPQSIQEKDAEEKEPIVKKEEVKPETKKVVVESKETIESIKETKPVEVLNDKPVNKIESAVTSEVTKVVSTEGKMSPKEIAAVVAAVMKQMKQDKGSEKSTNSAEVKENSLLIEELSDSEVDSVSEDLMNELENVDISENTKIDNSQKQIDVYNKVNVQDTSGSDTLSQLSQQISSLIDEEDSSSSSNSNNKNQAATYTQSLKSEVTVRTNEMRIIVVKKGDTLGKIAKRAYGNVMEYKRIYQANPEVTRPDRIYIGQKLRIPN